MNFLIPSGNHQHRIFQPSMPASQRLDTRPEVIKVFRRDKLRIVHWVASTIHMDFFSTVGLGFGCFETKRMTCFNAIRHAGS